MTALANAERLAHEAIAAALRPPAPIDYLAWAEGTLSSRIRSLDRLTGPSFRTSSRSCALCRRQILAGM